jgi:hypothetical protein
MGRATPDNLWLRECRSAKVRPRQDDTGKAWELVLKGVSVLLREADEICQTIPECAVAFGCMAPVDKCRRPVVESPFLKS